MESLEASTIIFSFHVALISICQMIAFGFSVLRLGLIIEGIGESVAHIGTEGLSHYIHMLKSVGKWKVSLYSQMIANATFIAGIVIIFVFPSTDVISC